MVVISGFVTMVDLLLQAYLPALSEGLGVFIPLIVVNCIILGRAEAFASKNGVLASAADGLHSGTGLHRGPGGHVYHPGASGQRHLRRRTPERGRGNSRSARMQYPGHDDDPARGRLPDPGRVSLPSASGFPEALDQRQREREAEKRKEAAVK